MNFKSTAVLLVLLLAVGGYVLFTRDKGTTTDAPATPPVHTVLDVKSADVTAITVTGADGKVAVAMEKVADAWHVTQPVKAVADTYAASQLLDAVTTDLKSTNTIKAADAPKTGVDHPQYTVDVVAGGKTTKLAIGDKLGVGDGVYAQVAGADTINVIPATVLETLAKPVNDLRKKQLFDGVTSADVKQFTITHKDGTKLELQKAGSTWKVVGASPMPADTTAVEDILATVINLTPVSFVDDPSEAVGLTHPNDVISFSTAAPATQPATSQPAMTVVTVGGYDDVQKKNVYAALADGTTVKVAATLLDSLNKSALDLRDKTVLDIDPATVTTVAITTDSAATTQPTSKPAVSKTVVLTRRPPKPAVMGPSTGPTSAPTTAPATVWIVDGTDADDTKVTTLLGHFHPLKADKYLATSAIANPARKFTVTLTSGSNPPVVVHLDDPGHDLSMVGTANGLTFNLPTSVGTDLAAEFKK